MAQENKKDPSYHKRKYQTFRHHAWAGTGFLSVFLATRLLFPDYSLYLNPIIIILIIYIIVSLLFTFRYREGLHTEEQKIQIPKSEVLTVKELDIKLEKEKIKLEKKKAKAESKAVKRIKKIKKKH